MKTFVIDLDHTICIPQLQFSDTLRRYAHATPIRQMIEFMQDRADNGDKIVIHTARRMLTHNGDVSKIEDDVGLITREWLTFHEVPYDELVFGKPYGDVYVDDKAVRPDECINNNYKF